MTQRMLNLYLLFINIHKIDLLADSIKTFAIQTWMTWIKRERFPLDGGLYLIEFNQVLTLSLWISRPQSLT